MDIENHLSPHTITSQHHQSSTQSQIMVDQHQSSHQSSHHSESPQPMPSPQVTTHTDDSADQTDIKPILHHGQIVSGNLQNGHLIHAPHSLDHLSTTMTIVASPTHTTSAIIHAPHTQFNGIVVTTTDIANMMTATFSKQGKKQISMRK